jgi:hypothetical protein
MKNLFVAAAIVFGTVAFSACGGEKGETTTTDSTATIETTTDTVMTTDTVTVDTAAADTSAN